MKKSKLKNLEADLQLLAEKQGVILSKKHLRRAKRIYLRQPAKAREHFSLIDSLLR